MFSAIINTATRKLTPPQCQPLTIEEVYPCLVGQAERNKKRMDAIKAEMGTKWIMHPDNSKKRLKKPRHV